MSLYQQPSLYRSLLLWICCIRGKVRIFGAETDVGCWDHVDSSAYAHWVDSGYDWYSAGMDLEERCLELFDLLVYYRSLSGSIYLWCIIPVTSDSKLNIPPNSFKSKPALNTLPYACRMTTLALCIVFILVNVDYISLKNVRFMAFRAFGREIVMRIILS